MDTSTRERLLHRNGRITRAVIAKAERLCPGSVALIGIGGSFQSGDYHEKSDLDLFIVAEEERANVLSSCFILDGIGFDIYLSSWETLENMAAYENPYCGKLFHLDLVYVKDGACEARYLALRRQLAEKLNAPLSPEDVEKSRGWLKQAETAYVDVMLADEIGPCRYASAEVQYYIEFAVYMLNKRYVKRGIQRIPEELRQMPILPEGFMRWHEGIVLAEDIAQIRLACTRLLKATRECFARYAPEAEKQPLTAQALAGTYEEIQSNWREKMQRAADIASPYLAFSTISSCQNFFNKMAQKYDIIPIDLIGHYTSYDLQAAAKAFDRAMEQYLRLYRLIGVDVRRYATIDEFERNYLA